jgi:adenylate cyclase
MNFLAELRRRKVVRVAAVYAATGFVVIQAAELLAAGLGLPAWVFPTVTVLVVLGFPVALVLAWALDITPEGLRVTPPAEPDGPKSRGTGTAPTLLGRRALVLSALLVAVGVGLGFGAGRFLGTDAGPATAAAPDLLAPGGPAADNSIAVLPFADLSQSGDQKWFADGLAEEILSSLARLPELRVVGLGSSYRFQDAEREDAEIAAALGVSHLLKGSVRRVADQLRVTAQLLRADDGVQLWSESYDGASGDLLDVQRDVAEKVAVALDILMDDERRERMFEAGTRNVAAFEAYLRGREIFVAAHGAGGSLAEANVWFERAMELDPRFGRPALLHADRYAHRVLFGPGDRRLDLEHMTVEEALARLRRSLDLAVRHAPDPFDRVLAELDREFFAPTWHRLPALVNDLRRHVAETRLSGADSWTAFLLVAVGQPELARDFAMQWVRSDPLEPVAWSHLVLSQVALGDLPGAGARLLEARRAAGDHGYLREAEITIHLLSGEPDAARSLLRGSFRHHRSLDAALRGDSAAALAYAREIEAAEDWPDYLLLTVYHQLGDAERSRALTRRIDALASGHAIFAVLLYRSGGALTFDLADAPNFSARLREAGADPGSFRTMPRSRALQE